MCFRQKNCFWVAGLALCTALLGAQSQGQITPFAFWKSQNLYTWMGGSSLQVQSGIYGTQGTAGASTTPGIRSQASSWLDSSGNIWLFGGLGYDSTGTQNYLNDLWKYNPSTSQWTWISGSNSMGQMGVYGTQGVSSSSNIPGARAAATSWIDSSGNLWLFGGAGYGGGGNYLNDLWKFNPTNSQWTWVAGTSNPGQSGVYGTKGTGSTSNYPGGRTDLTSWNDGAGNFWIFGGYGLDTNGSANWLNDLWEYTVATSKWTWISGAKTGGASGTYGTKGTGSTSNTPGAHLDATSWLDSSGNLWLFGGDGADSTATFEYMNDLWKFTPSTKKWTWVGGSNFVDGAATYGTKGTGSTTNIPGARRFASGALDSSGNFWLFGGLGFDSTGTRGDLNDLWKFNPTNSQWTWVSGSSLQAITGVYGTKGTANSSNVPGSRQSQIIQADTSGNIWVFGGYGFDSLSNTTNNRITNLNDLWQFSTSSGNWTWLTGSSLDLQQGTFGTLGVASANNAPSARTSAATWADSSGNLWLLGGMGIDNVDDAPAVLNDFWKYSSSSGQWTWIAGAVTYGQSGVYGTLGTGSTSNFPGARSASLTWMDTSGNLWLFGGYAVDSTGAWSDINDLWKYNPSNSQWTWVSGPSTGNGAATYGTKGTGSTSNIPGPRDSSATWIDTSGNLWLFGGYSKDSAGTYDYTSDLWKFNPANSQWTWVSGPNLAAQIGTYGTKGTAGPTMIPGGRETRMSWLDTSGNLWLFGGLGYDASGNGGTINDLWEFNPSSSQWTWMAGNSIVGAAGTYGTKGVGATSNIPGARMQAAAWTDGAGNFWLLGGNANDSSGTGVYANDLWKFTPANSQWTWVAGASLGVASGVYNTVGVPNISNSPGGRVNPMAWRSKDGTVWIFGGQGFDAVGTEGFLNDLWKITP